MHKTRILTFRYCSTLVVRATTSTTEGMQDSVDSRYLVVVVVTVVRVRFDFVSNTALLTLIGHQKVSCI